MNHGLDSLQAKESAAPLPENPLIKALAENAISYAQGKDGDRWIADAALNWMRGERERLSSEGQNMTDQEYWQAKQAVLAAEPKRTKARRKTH